MEPSFAESGVGRRFAPLASGVGSRASGSPFFFVSRSPRVEERGRIWTIPYPLSATRRVISRRGSHAAGRQIGGTPPRGRAEAIFSTPGIA